MELTLVPPWMVPMFSVVRDPEGAGSGPVRRARRRVRRWDWGCRPRKAVAAGAGDGDPKTSAAEGLGDGGVGSGAVENDVGGDAAARGLLL